MRNAPGHSVIASLLPTLALLISAATLVACDDETECGVEYEIDFGEIGTEVAVGDTVETTLTVRQCGDPLSGGGISIASTSGGGDVSPVEAVTDAAGEVAVTFTLGSVPVVNTYRVAVADVGGASPAFATSVSFEPTLDPPYDPAPFVDVDTWMIDNGLEGSTEDLAFGPDGNMYMGVTEALIRITPVGDIDRVATTGAELRNPLGIAFDAAGNAWIADSDADALLMMTPAGVLSIVVDEANGAPLEAPNHVAVSPDGLVVFSDPCLGLLVAYDPGTDTVTQTLDFDLAADGGPNGIAFDPAGGAVYVLTENTSVLCNQPRIPYEDELAGLFRFDFDGSALANRSAVAPQLGVFGDGLAFDGEGNLYTIFDTIDVFSLDESTIYVHPAGDFANPVKLAAATDRIFANLLFGEGEFGEGNLYIAMLSIPPLTDESTRGVEVISLSIPGPSVRPE